MIADFFSIFDPDWWMDENNNALQIADAILFLIMALQYCIYSFAHYSHWVSIKIHIRTPT